MQFLHQMFNVSALLLDDALKPATPLTNGASFWVPLLKEWVETGEYDRNTDLHE